MLKKATNPHSDLKEEIYVTQLYGYRVIGKEK